MTNTIVWKKLVAEGLVILVSIVLAFGIDAWWDRQTHRELVEKQWTQLHVQMSTNLDVLATGERSARTAMESLQTLVDVIGPNPPLITADSLARLMRQGLSPGQSDLEEGAVRALLASVDFGLESGELHRELIAFQANAATLTRNRALFDDLRERFVAYVNTASSSALLSGGVGGTPPTDFAVPVEALLRDGRLEGMAGNLAIRVRVILRHTATLRERTESIVRIVQPGAI